MQCVYNIQSLEILKKQWVNRFYALFTRFTKWGKNRALSWIFLYKVQFHKKGKKNVIEVNQKVSAILNDVYSFYFYETLNCTLKSIVKIIPETKTKLIYFSLSTVSCVLVFLPVTFFRASKFFLVLVCFSTRDDH